MDWENLNADVNCILSKHYSSGRGSYSINKIVIHYNAGDLTVEGCYSVWQSREASAHYQVESGGRIGQLVWDSDTAWHCGNFPQNQQSIGIEHANKEGGYVTDECLDAGAHLVAALCKYYKLGRPEWKKNVFPHSYFSATSCPGRLQDDQNAAYMQRAQEWYDSMVNGTAAPSGGSSSSSSSSSSTSNGSTSSKKSVSEVAKDVIAGKYGNGDARRSAVEAAGYNYDEVQAEVNRQLGVSSGSSSSSSSVNIDQLAQDVIAGKYGSGEARKQALGANYDAVQKRVNEILLGTSGSSSSSSSSNLNKVVDDVLAGKYGNGDTRRKNLEAAGYNYSEVQAAVNARLGVSSSSGSSSSSSKSFSVGDNVRVTNAVDENGTRIAASGTYKVMEVKGSRVVIGRNGVVTAAMPASNLAHA